MKGQAIQVLYVEDDPTDAEFAEIAFKEMGCKNVRLQIAVDGEEAVRRFGVSEHGEGNQRNALPNVLLLDLNLPEVPGKDLLKLIKQNERLKNMPVVILSTSDHQKDINEVYGLGTAGILHEIIRPERVSWRVSRDL